MFFPGKIPHSGSTIQCNAQMWEYMGSCPVSTALGSGPRFSLLTLTIKTTTKSWFWYRFYVKAYIQHFTHSFTQIADEDFRIIWFPILEGNLKPNSGLGKLRQGPRLTLGSLPKASEMGNLTREADSFQRRCWSPTKRTTTSSYYFAPLVVVFGWTIHWVVNWKKRFIQ